MRKFTLVLLAAVVFSSCEEDAKPKPKAFLALEYPEAEYESVNLDCPFVFEINTMAEVTDSRSNRPCWKNIVYRSMKGEIFITYSPIDNNLDSLLMDAQKLPLQHTIKADAIEGDIYTNESSRTYGMFYEVAGDAASQAQFYITDSVNHFLTGSVYFNAQPNFDSILPAAAYLKEDIRHLMETVRWKRSGP
jgi:gliding motility-associated lipoprotein GldD